MTAEMLALFVAGLIASPFIQFVKERLGLSGTPALWLSMIVSVLIAFGALLGTGELMPSLIPTDPVAFISELLGAAATVFGLATVVYKAKFARPA